IKRREFELMATVLKAAEYERRRIETLAEAEKMRLVMEAEGRAAAIRAQGEAEAEIIFKKGDAEARAMNVKAEAYQEFNQAAIVDKLITGMPEIVRALASPPAIVDQHVLERKLKENDDSEKQWQRRAEMAVDQHDEPLARAALARAMTHQSMTESFRQQVEDQKTQVENLKSALLKLQQKLIEA